MKNRKPLPGEPVLLITAVIWGSSFVAQKLGAEYIKSFTYNGVRSLIGALVIGLTVLVLNRARGGRPPRAEYLKILKGGAICGVLLFAAVNFQQLAISSEGASIGKVGFLTAMYIVLVPVLGVFLGKRAGLVIWISVGIAVVGMLLLTGSMGSESIGTGDIYAIISALMFAAQIIAVDYLAPDVDCLRLSMTQFTVCGALSIAVALIFEKPTMSAVMDTKWPLLYSGIMSSGIAYTLQMVGQKNCKPQVASLIMSLESVFCAICGFLFLGESMSVNEVAGSVLMFAAVILTQIKFGKPATDGKQQHN